MSSVKEDIQRIRKMLEDLDSSFTHTDEVGHEAECDMTDEVESETECDMSSDVETESQDDDFSMAGQRYRTDDEKEEAIKKAHGGKIPNHRSTDTNDDAWKHLTQESEDDFEEFKFDEVEGVNEGQIDENIDPFSMVDVANLIKTQLRSNTFVENIEDGSDGSLVIHTITGQEFKVEVTDLHNAAFAGSKPTIPFRPIDRVLP